MEDNKKVVDVEFETVEESDARMGNNSQTTKEESGVLATFMGALGKVANFAKEWGPTLLTIGGSFYLGNKYGQNKERSRQQKLASSKGAYGNSNWADKKPYYYKKNND